MPIYEYQCPECKTSIEIIESIQSPETVQNCSKCHKLMKRVISPCNFKLKGGGWYSDGYSKEG